MVSLDDPVAVARRWSLEGFNTLHVVDLDAATDRGSNADVVERIVESVDTTIQVGGGIRTAEQIERLAAIGVARVVVGTRALEDRDWLENMSVANPGKLIIALDVRHDSIVSHGWQKTHDSNIANEISALNDLPLAALLVTAVHREGQMEGPDVSLIEKVVRLSSFPVQASGGIASLSDLKQLESAGAAAAIVGMALYTGVLSAREINEAFIA
jgi:phosphoribosylformimino-5-aminoimidazole carboxamide ribotide isomerase